MWHAVSIAIELESQIFVNQRFDRVAVVVRNDGQRTEGLGLEALYRALPCLAVQSLVGDFCSAIAAPGGSHHADR